MKMKQQSGFTLLEFMLAFALLTVILSAVFISQGSTLSASVRNKNILIATNLARNFINEREVKYENISFDRLPADETSGNFPEPYQAFKWKIKFEEIDFSALSSLLAKQSEAENPNATDNAQTQTVMKLFQDYLKKSIRRMTVTVEWPEGSGTTGQTFTEFLVNYDQEISTGI